MQRDKADILHLGSGEDYHEDAWNVDVVPDVNPDEIYNLEELPWPWDDESWDTIRAYHVFEHLSDIQAALVESARLLRPGGHLVLKLPMGNDAYADPDHTWGGSHPWTWRTPEFYTGKRHWDVDVGLEVINRNVDLWPIHQTKFQKAIARLWWNYLLRHRAGGEWAFSLSQMCGEFTVVFEKP